MSAPQLRQVLHLAQGELAIICKDAIYKTDRLCELLYEIVPSLHNLLQDEYRAFDDVIDVCIPPKEKP